MQSILNFVLELDRLKSIERKVRPTGLTRFENPAEHSWQIALFAMSLQPYAPREMDIHRVVSMLLVHDIGEIDAGDIFVFDGQAAEQQSERELSGVKRILMPLAEPTRSLLLELWNEFEAGHSVEARFAHAVDRAMPVLLNLANNGGSWREHGITYDRVVERVGPEIKAGCLPLWDHLLAQLDQARHDGWFSEPRHSPQTEPTPW